MIHHPLSPHVHAEVMDAARRRAVALRDEAFDDAWRGLAGWLVMASRRLLLRRGAGHAAPRPAAAHPRPAPSSCAAAARSGCA